MPRDCRAVTLQYTRALLFQLSLPCLLCVDQWNWHRPGPMTGSPVRFTTRFRRDEDGNENNELSARFARGVHARFMKRVGARGLT